MSEIVELLGMIAGAVWISAAIYFQMVRAKRIHPAWVSFLFLVGMSTVMGSAAVAVRGPQLAESLAIAGNLLLLAVGIGVAVGLEYRADLDERKCVEETDAADG